MKKILFCSSRFEPYIGGTEILVKMVIEGFINKFPNYEIHLLTLKHKERQPNKIIFHEFEDVISLQEQYNLLSKENFDYSFCFFDINSDLLRFFNKNISKNNICILNFDDSHKNDLGKYDINIKNLQTFNLVTTFTKKCFVNKFLEKNNIKNTYIQNFSYDMLDKTKKLNKKELFNKLNLDENLKTILYLARIEPRKNQAHILKEIKNFKNKYNFIFMGGVEQWSIEYAKECLALIKQNTKHNISFVKPTSDLEKTKLIINTSDILLLSSTAEGLPLVALEALSAEIPCVLPPVGGIKGVFEDMSCVKILSSSFPKSNEIEYLIEKCFEEDRNKIRDIWTNNFSYNIVTEKYINLVN